MHISANKYNRMLVKCVEYMAHLYNTVQYYLQGFPRAFLVYININEEKGLCKEVRYWAIDMHIHLLLSDYLEKMGKKYLVLY